MSLGPRAAAATSRDKERQDRSLAHSVACEYRVVCEDEGESLADTNRNRPEFGVPHDGD